MVLKIPPPPQFAGAMWQMFNRWLIELQNILNSQGSIDGTAVTQPPGTNDDTIATTAFVLANTASAPSTTLPLVDSGAGAVGASTTYARGDHVHPTDTSRAPLANPIFTGNPKAPTAAVNDNSASIATTAFVENQIAAAAALVPLIRNGAGVPAAGLGSVNDWYADTTNKHIYVKTGVATWTLIV